MWSQCSWFVFSMITLLCWGLGDLFCKLGTKPNDTYSHLRMVIMVGLCMGAHALIFQISMGVWVSPMLLLRYLPVSLLYIVSMALGYVGLRYIELSVSSPVCNSSGAITAILCFFILGQQVNAGQIVAICAIGVGLILLGVLEKGEQTLVQGEEKFRIGLIAFVFPLLYCLLDGVGTFLDAYYLENALLSEEEALIAYEYTFLLTAAACAFYMRCVKKVRLQFFQQKPFMVSALCETAGQYFYVYALADAGKAIVAAPMIASYSIVSVILARLFLKERLVKWQYFAIVLVMIGIAILGMEG